MSFAWTISTWMAITAGATAAVSLYTSDQASKNQANALQQAKQQAQSQQLASDEANNRANAKSPDVAALMSANLLAAKNGQAGTMLTGPSGVDPNSLTLGKNTLLGGG